MATRNIDNADSRNARGNGGDAKATGETVAEKSDGDIAGAGAGAGSGSGAGAGSGAVTGAGVGTGAGTGTLPDAGGKTVKTNHPVVSPASISPDNYMRDENGAIIYKADGVTPRKRPGRKAGSSVAGTVAPKSSPAKSDSARAAVATEMLAAQFQILNLGIATLTKFEDFKLDDSEALEMAKATANVMAQFDYVPDPKVAAVLGLVTTTSMIYGPRVYLFNKSRAAKKVERRAKGIVEADERAANQGNAFPDGPLNMGQFSG